MLDHALVFNEIEMAYGSRTYHNIRDDSLKLIRLATTPHETGVGSEDWCVQKIAFNYHIQKQNTWYDDVSSHESATTLVGTHGLSRGRCGVPWHLCPTLCGLD